MENHRFPRVLLRVLAVLALIQSLAGIAAAQSPIDALLDDSTLDQRQQDERRPPSRGEVLTPTGGEVTLTPQAAVPTQPFDVLPPDMPSVVPGQPETVRPFGWQLFMPGSAVSRPLGINPAYKIAPGDKISVWMWGAQQGATTLTVDLQGNIFLPDVGPVMVGGLPQSEINRAVTNAVSRVYTDRVQVYTNLLGTQPIGVYVTGAVSRPGRFAGERTDSALYYIAQAGGVDLQRGSFRDIAVRRGGRTLASIDLYDFLLTGEIPALQFENNDTIVVGPQRATVKAVGEVRNSYLFELDIRDTDGASIMDKVQPLPRASHVALRGVRDGSPYTAYLPLDEFRYAGVQSGDEMVFQSDLVAKTIFVSAAGQVEGPSSFAVPRGTNLEMLLHMIPVDPRTADLNAIYLRRTSVAERQRQALERTLDQLQRSVLTTQATSASEAQIRVQEAQLVERFVERARSAVPEGRVILAGGQRPGDVLLEEGDLIVIPQKSDLVIVSGEVRMPQTILYRPGLKVSEAVDAAGGYSERGDRGTVLVLRSNGEVIAGSSPELRPGDHVMVLPDAGSKNMAIFKDIVEIIYRIAVSTGVVINLL